MWQCVNLIRRERAVQKRGIHLCAGLVCNLVKCSRPRALPNAPPHTSTFFLGFTPLAKVSLYKQTRGLFGIAPPSSRRRTTVCVYLFRVSARVIWSSYDIVRNSNYCRWPFDAKRFYLHNQCGYRFSLEQLFRFVSFQPKRCVFKYVVCFRTNCINVGVNCSFPEYTMGRRSNTIQYDRSDRTKRVQFIGDPMTNWHTNWR